MNRPSKIRKTIICLCVFMMVTTQVFGWSELIVDGFVASGAGTTFNGHQRVYLGAVPVNTAPVVNGGVLAGVAAHFAPDDYVEGQVAADDTGTIFRTMYQAQKFVTSSGAVYLAGRVERAAIVVGAAGSSVYNWIKANTSSLPSLGSLFNQAHSGSGPFTPGYTGSPEGYAPYLSTITCAGTLNSSSYTFDATPVNRMINGSWSIYMADMVITNANLAPQQNLWVNSGVGRSPRA